MGIGSICRRERSLGLTKLRTAHYSTGSIPCWSLWLHLFLPSPLLTPPQTHQTSCCSSNLPSSVQTQGLCTCCSLIWSPFPGLWKKRLTSLLIQVFALMHLLREAFPDQPIIKTCLFAYFMPQPGHVKTQIQLWTSQLQCDVEWTPQTSSPNWNFSSFSSSVFLPSCSSFLFMENASFHYSDPRLGTLYFPHTQHPISNAAGSTFKTTLGFQIKRD